MPFVPQDLLSGPKSAEAGRAAGPEQWQRGAWAAGATQKPPLSAARPAGAALPWDHICYLPNLFVKHS